MKSDISELVRILTKLRIRLITGPILIELSKYPYTGKTSDFFWVWQTFKKWLNRVPEVWLIYVFWIENLEVVDRNDKILITNDWLIF